MESKGLLHVVRAHGRDDGVSRVVASCAACAYIRFAREDIYKLSLSLVAPLGAKDNGDCMRA